MTPLDYIIVILCFAGLIAAAVWLIGAPARKRGLKGACGCSGKTSVSSSAPRRADGTSLSSGADDKSAAHGCSGNCTHCSGCR